MFRAASSVLSTLYQSCAKEARAPLPAGSVWAILVLLLVALILLVCRYADSYDGVPVVNRICALEPRVFSRIRFAFNAEQILQDAYRKVGQIASS